MKQFYKILVGIFSIGVLGALFVLGLFIYISFDLPKISSLADYKPAIPSVIKSQDGEVLLKAWKENREVVPFEKIPKKVVQAFLAAEDGNFYEHKGVDYKGLARAMLTNLKAGRVVQGGSTITQQVAKSLLLTRRKTITRKIKDFLLAQKIEEKFTKEEILYLYLNQVYLGGGYYGVKTAFKGYFDKELEDATIAETALIAGLLVAPSRYSPYVNPKYAKKRMNYVLKRLLDTGKIDEEEYNTAKNEVIRISTREGSELKAGYFTDWVRQQVSERLGNNALLTGGYEVVTSLNWKLQEAAEKYVKDGVREVDKRQGYKGPIKKINPEEFFEFYSNQRREILKKNSSHFLFKPDGTVEKEFDYSEEKFKETYAGFKEELKSLSKYWQGRVIAGVGTDKFVDFIEKEKEYEAVIEALDDNQHIAYARVAGVPVIIPYEGYRWAHERIINEERKYFPYIKRPSQVFNIGDVVLVRIKSDPTKIFSYLKRDFLKPANRKKIKEFLKNQSYLLGYLEQEPDAEGALLSLNPFNGEIISLVGGYDFEKSQFNRAIQSNRQPGSSFKPFLYAAALENGFRPNSILLDSPQALGAGADANLDWKPKNYDGKFKGEMTLRRSLEVSRNIPTIKLVQDIGVSKVLEFVKRIGITAELPKDLSISLGSFGISLLNLVRAYSIFPNSGRMIKPKAIISITDRDGKEIPFGEEEKKAELVEEPIEIAEVKEGEETNENSENSDEPKVKKNKFLENLDENQIYDNRLAYIMTNLLKGVVQNGTGRNARDISSFIGGKTGTTNNYVDAWFLGFSSNVVTGVWVGFDDNKTLGWPETGSKSALPIWKKFMADSIKKFGETDFSVPEGIVNVMINKVTGKSAESTENTILESFVIGDEPGKEEETVRDEENKSSEPIVLDDDEYYSAQ